MSEIDVMISLNPDSALRGEGGRVPDDTLPSLVKAFKGVTVERVFASGNVMRASIPADAFDMIDIELAQHCIIQRRSL